MLHILSKCFLGTPTTRLHLLNTRRLPCPSRQRISSVRSGADVKLCAHLLDFHISLSKRVPCYCPKLWTRIKRACRNRINHGLHTQKRRLSACLRNKELLDLVKRNEGECILFAVFQLKNEHRLYPVKRCDLFYAVNVVCNKFFYIRQQFLYLIYRYSLYRQNLTCQPVFAFWTI